MKRFFSLQSNWLIHFFALSILLTGVWATLFPLGYALYDDPFHHGEFVASLPSVLGGNINFFTIHGAMDWLPAWFSQQVFGIDKHFLPTMLAHASLGALASLFLYFVIALLTNRDNKYRSIILLTSAVLAVYLVGDRDIFLVLSIWLYFLCERNLSQRGCNLFEIALGMSLAINLLWSFDRGAAGIVGIGLACLITVVSEKRFLLSILSFSITLEMLHWIGVLSFSNYINNFQFLMATSSQWSYGYAKFGFVLFTTLVSIPNGWAIYYLGKQLHQKSQIGWGKTASIISLAILTILMFKIGINRADFQHVVMALWMPALTFLYLYKINALKLSVFANATIMFAIIWLALRGNNFWILFGAIIPAIYVNESKYPRLTSYITSQKFAIITFAIPLIFFNMFRMSSNFYQNGYQWMSQLSVPPTNQLLVSESIQWVSAEILKIGSHCVFDLSNNGVINGVTGLPACTKYIYPVYATQRYEADMIQQLLENNPPVVVFSTTYSSFKVSGDTMHDHFPALKEYLVKAYPYEKCNFGYCLRYVNQP
jgi:hypothetical protein